MIKKGIAYLLIITALLYLVRYLHYEGLLRQRQGYYAKYKTAFLEHNTFDVLIAGSSRAEMHYDTRLFDSLTGKHAFSLSMAGATPHVIYAALKTYLSKSDAPRYLVYEVDYHTLKDRSLQIREFNNYFPFLRDGVFRHEVSRIDRRMLHFYYDPFFSLPYTGLKNLSTSLHGWLGIPNKTDSLYHNGFFKEVLRPHLDYIPLEKINTWFDVVEHRYMDSIILLCRSKQINVTLASSPIFGGGKLVLKNKPFIIQQLKHIAAYHGISYFDLSSLPFCNRRNLFIDYNHLNYAGARQFTRYFSVVFNNKIALPALK